jgi:methylmalonyl-CoA carboxyltransferase large subunit
MKDSDLRQALDEIRTSLADLAARVEALEGGQETRTPAHSKAGGSMPLPAARPVPPPGITEEIVIAIAAAVAAFLGERAHVRQIRLISSSAWAQQGRVSVQASHRLDR